ncbi:MAG TPA: DUF1491 family protein [Sphingomicrobium sp.]|nr:DUF1491 family protein [Sphingomicrobium sp.]
MSERLPASLEVAALLRRMAAEGNFATVMKKGDPDRGSLLILVASRGQHVACLERVLNLDGSYRWETVGPGDSASSTEIADFLARRTRFDEDMWAVELDIADPERFIAETTSVG